MEDVIELTKELIRIESTNPGAGEKEIAEYICGYLADAGVEIVCDEVVKDRWNIVAEIPAGDGSWNVTGNPALVLICHMDTVVVGNGWTRAPFGAEEENGRIYGRGSCDMKSGLACALSVFRKTALDVKAGKKRLSHALRLICTADEEGNMAGAEQAVRKGYVTGKDMALDLEPTDGQIQMGHKGRLWVRLCVYGITAHASRPEQGADAIAAAAELIVQIRRALEACPEHPEMGRSTVTFGQIEGGYQPYVVPDECRVWIDFRLAPPVDDKKALEIVEEACRAAERNIKGIRSVYRITGNRPCIEENRKSRLYVELKKAAEKVCGKEPETGVFPGYTDTAVIAGMSGNGECMSYGPGSLRYAHKPDEFVDCEDVVRCEKVLMELVDRVL